MTTKPSVPFEVRWTITDRGRAAADETDFCPCEMRLVGMMLRCETCGTIYGHIRDGVIGRPKSKRYGKPA